MTKSKKQLKYSIKFNKSLNSIFGQINIEILNFNKKVELKLTDMNFKELIQKWTKKILEKVVN